MTATIHHDVDRDRLASANAVRARRAAERATVEAMKRITALEDKTLAALAEFVENETQRRHGRAPLRWGRR
jgi:hypothetical protein